MDDRTTERISSHASFARLPLEVFALSVIHKCVRERENIARVSGRMSLEMRKTRGGATQLEQKREEEKRSSRKNDPLRAFATARRRGATRRGGAMLLITAISIIVCVVCRNCFEVTRTRRGLRPRSFNRGFVLCSALRAIRAAAPIEANANAQMCNA